MFLCINNKECVLDLLLPEKDTEFSILLKKESS